MPKISSIRIIESPSATDMAPPSLESDLAWVEKRGVDVTRSLRDSLSQDATPEGPVETPLFPLPLVLVDGNIALSGRYPTREEMGIWMMFGLVTGNDSNGGIRCCTL